MTSVMNPGLVAETNNEAIRMILIDGIEIPVEQVLFKTKEFSVFELKEKVSLSGLTLKRLAVTRDHKVFSINVLAGPLNLLAECLGDGTVEWV